VWLVECPSSLPGLHTSRTLSQEASDASPLAPGVICGGRVGGETMVTVPRSEDMHEAAEAVRRIIAATEKMQAESAEENRRSRLLRDRLDLAANVLDAASGHLPK
jgi:hypothetical protein